LHKTYRLPYKVNGVTVEDEDGFYNVYINARLSYTAQREAIIHELTHIQRNDFYSEEKLELIESM
jgi:hypothetical protein